MTIIQGQVALVTGGASGIGLLMSEMLLRKGARKVIVWDVSQPNLDQARERLGSFGPASEFMRVDVSNTAALLASVQALKAAGTTVDILINSAGIVVGRPFAEHSHEEIDQIMSVNIRALMHLTRALLPGMTAQDRGHIVNIASAAGMVSNPNMSVYCGSKWAVIGWSDSLRLELEKDHPGVHVTTVLPYYIDTGMFDGVISPILPILKPVPTARRIIQAIEGNRIFLRMPWLLNLVPLIKGLMPTRAFDLIAGRMFGIYGSMDQFKGRRH